MTRRSPLFSLLKLAVATVGLLVGGTAGYAEERGFDHDGINVRLTGTGAADSPCMFTVLHPRIGAVREISLNAPARVVLDLAGVKVTRPNTILIEGNACASALRFGVQPDGTRIVFDLVADRSPVFQTETVAGKVVVMLQGSSSTSPTPPTAVEPTAAAGSIKLSLQIPPRGTPTAPTISTATAASTPTLTPSKTPTASPTSTSSATPTHSPSTTPTSTRTASATPTATESPTVTKTATSTASPIVSPTTTPTSTHSATPTHTSLPTATVTATVAVTATATMPSSTATSSSAPTPTRSTRATSTALPTASAGPELSLAVDQSLVEFSTDERPVRNLTVTNTGARTVYVAASTVAVLAAGRENESEVESQELLVSPLYFSLKGGAQRMIRLVGARSPEESERIYRVYLVAQETEFDPTNAPKPHESAQKLAVSVLRAPTASAIKLGLRRRGKRIVITNDGNRSVRVSEVKLCSDSAPQECQELPERRLYPSNQWAIPAPKDFKLVLTKTVAGESETVVFEGNQ